MISGEVPNVAGQIDLVSKAEAIVKATHEQLLALTKDSGFGLVSINIAVDNWEIELVTYTPYRRVTVNGLTRRFLESPYITEITG